MLHVDVESTDGRGKLFQVVSILPYFEDPDGLYFKIAFKKSGSTLEWQHRRSTDSLKQP